jgi:hypothetical protein
LRILLRSLFGLMLLAWIFLAGWRIARQRAVTDVKTASGGFSPTIGAPYLLRIEKSDNITVVATYHVWCFGLIYDLPISRQFAETGGFVSCTRPRIVIQREEPKLLGFPDN